MMLYRLTYHRLAGESSITFWAADLIDAERFRAMWLRITGSVERDFVPLGRSHFMPRRAYTRQHSSLTLTNEEQFQLEVSNG